VAADDVFRRAYEFATGDDDEARACADIPEEACKDVPRSFSLNVLNGTSTKLAEQLASPGLVLPWLLGAIGAPAALTGWLVPAKQVGSLLPQLFIAGYLRGYERRKSFWSAAGLTQMLMLLLMALAAALLPATAAGVLIVVGLLLFSIASGVGSVAFSDVVGKTVPKGRRGRMLALRATLGGILALAAGVLMRRFLGESQSSTPYIVLLCIAAGLWGIGSLLFALIPEPKGATGGGANAIRKALEGLGLVRSDRILRRFIIARCLLLSVELAMPYFVLFGRREANVAGSDLGIFVIAVSLAAVLSSPVWGRFADAAAHRTLAASGIVGAVSVGAALLIAVLPDGWNNAYVFAIAFILLGLAEGGARLGRKTYLVDIAPTNEKGTFKAVSNTIAGVVMLGAGGLGFIADALGANVLLVALAAAMLLGSVIAWTLPAEREGG
jgi:MFS family permease